MQRYVLLLALAALTACSQKSAPPQAQTVPSQEAPAPHPLPSLQATFEEGRVRAGRSGRRATRQSAFTLLFRVSHMGFRISPRASVASMGSCTSTRATHGDAADGNGRCALDRDRLPRSQLRLQRRIAGRAAPNAAKFPEITSRTDKGRGLGNNALRVHGELTLRGVTKPIVLDATYNGGYLKHPMDPEARVGFSAHGVLRRTDFGISGGIRVAGSNLVLATRSPSSSSRNSSARRRPGGIRRLSHHAPFLTQLFA